MLMLFCVSCSLNRHIFCLYSCYLTGRSVPLKYRMPFFIRVCLISVLSYLNSFFPNYSHCMSNPSVYSSVMINTICLLIGEIMKAAIWKQLKRANMSNLFRVFRVNGLKGCLFTKISNNPIICEINKVASCWTYTFISSPKIS